MMYGASTIASCGTVSARPLLQHTRRTRYVHT
jgi:hypothetical protein